MQTKILSISKGESSEYLDSIYTLNQKNTPEVGSLTNEEHLKKLQHLETKTPKKVPKTLKHVYFCAGPGVKKRGS